MLTEMETLSVTLDKQGSVQYGNTAKLQERFLGEYGIQKHGRAMGCVRYEGRSGYRERQREMLRGSRFVSLPSSEMELTSADCVTLRSSADCYKICATPGVRQWEEP